MKRLATLTLIALLFAGCGSGDDDDTAAAPVTTKSDQAVTFSECMRENGVRSFPDPDASGELTIDAVVNGSSIDPDGPAWKQAIAACKDLQPSGFTGRKATPSQQDARLEFAQCIRENGVKDFPDPGPDDPLVNTNKIPSTNSGNGMTVLNAAMRTCGNRLGDRTGVKAP